MDFIGAILLSSWQLLVEMAPYLWIGFLAAGALHMVVTEAFVRKHLGKAGWWQTIKAALIGVPLPLCSCGVIPVAAGLRRQGASKGALTSFVASTPQTGLDSIAATWAVFGWPFTLARVVIAFLSGAISGTLVDRFTRPDANEEAREAEADSAAASCCSGDRASTPFGEATFSSAPPTSCCSKPKPAPVISIAQPQSACGSSPEPKSKSACCCSEAPEQKDETSSCCSEVRLTDDSRWRNKLRSGLNFGLVTLPRDIGWALLGGILLAGVITVVMPSDFFDRYLGHLWLSYIMVTLAAVPLYVCATGSIPLAYALLASGLSPGGVLVFLIAGPATNAATVTAMAQMLGRTGVLIYLGSLVLISWICGATLDLLELPMKMLNVHHHTEHIAWWRQLLAGLLLVWMASALFTQFRQRQQQA